MDLDTVHMPIWDIDRLGQLRGSPSLDHLEIYLDRDADHHEPAPVKQVQPVPNVTHLSLSAGMSLSTAAASNFLSHFTRLTHLDLNLIDYCNLGLFLGAVSPTLVSLIVELDNWDIWLEDDSSLLMNSHLARLTNLEELSLGEHTFSHGIFPTLSSLANLHGLTLWLLFDAHFDATPLKRYLREHPPLRRLSFHAFSGGADYIPSEHPDDPAVSSGSYSFGRGWRLPEWTPSFTFEDAKEVLRLVDAAGIVLEGGLRRAVEVQELRWREEEYLKGRRAEAQRKLGGCSRLTDDSSDEE
ncbi:hypothetical protein JCM10207_004454 [Rhodosporidiobolus poonsookiae]